MGFDCTTVLHQTNSMIYKTQLYYIVWVHRLINVISFLQKIADFGLATQLSVPDEKHFTMCGTPNYISP